MPWNLKVEYSFLPPALMGQDIPRDCDEGVWYIIDKVWFDEGDYVRLYLNNQWDIYIKLDSRPQMFVRRCLQSQLGWR